MYRIQHRTASAFFQRCLMMPTRAISSSKDVPTKRRNYSDDEHRYYWPARMINQQLRHMERMFDEFVPWRVQSWWNKPSWIRDYPMIRSEQDVKVEYNDKHYEIKLNVENYNPEELNVKISGDHLIISGKHREKPDKYGYISREFSRQFVIPEDVNQDSIESSFDGNELILRGTVTGSENIQERTIDVRQHPKDQAEK